MKYSFFEILVARFISLSAPLLNLCIYIFNSTLYSVFLLHPLIRFPEDKRSFLIIYGLWRPVNEYYVIVMFVGSFDASEYHATGATPEAIGDMTQGHAETGLKKS